MTPSVKPLAGPGATPAARRPAPRSAAIPSYTAGSCSRCGSLQEQQVRADDPEALQRARSPAQVARAGRRPAQGVGEARSLAPALAFVEVPTAPSGSTSRARNPLTARPSSASASPAIGVGRDAADAVAGGAALAKSCRSPRRSARSARRSRCRQRRSRSTTPRGRTAVRGARREVDVVVRAPGVERLVGGRMSSAASPSREKGEAEAMPVCGPRTPSPPARHRSALDSSGLGQSVSRSSEPVAADGRRSRWRGSSLSRARPRLPVAGIGWASVSLIPEVVEVAEREDEALAVALRAPISMPSSRMKARVEQPGERVAIGRALGRPARSWPSPGWRRGAGPRSFRATAAVDRGRRPRCADDLAPGFERHDVSQWWSRWRAAPVHGRGELPLWWRARHGRLRTRKQPSTEGGVE
jgi:hypothetical protein